jgi:hypothetical protein
MSELVIQDRQHPTPAKRLRNHVQADVNVLGGSGEQSQRVLEAMTKLWAAPGARRDRILSLPENQISPHDRTDSLQLAVRILKKAQRVANRHDVPPLQSLGPREQQIFGGRRRLDEPALAHPHQFATRTQRVRCAATIKSAARVASLQNVRRVCAIGGRRFVADRLRPQRWRAKRLTKPFGLRRRRTVSGGGESLEETCPHLTKHLTT